MRGLGQDLRYALRLLAKSPGFTFAAIVALALGIGASTAIFSVVRAVLLRPLPYAEAERVVMVWDSNPSRGWDTFAVSPGNFSDWSEAQTPFDLLVALRDSSFILTGAGDPERLRGVLASRGLFDLMGVEPARGRAFAPGEYSGGGCVVVISDGLWKRRFGERADILGLPVTLNAESCAVAGVMPPGHRLPSGADLVAPLVLSAEDRQRRGSHYLVVMARLARGITLETAATVMTSLAAANEKAWPDSNTGWTIRVVPLHEEVVGEVRPALLALGGAVACLFLIACANVANLLLARAASRRSEIAVRSALGARPARLLRQLLTESVVLALLGGGLGTLLAVWGVDLIRTLQPGTLPRASSIAVDGPVLAFTLALSVLTGILFGVLPGVLLARARLAGALQESGRGERGRMSGRVRAALVAAQVALAQVLLVGAGLHVRSLASLMSVDPGFQADGVMAAGIAKLPPRRYPDRPRQAAYYDRVLEALAALPGVTSAAACSTVPLAGSDRIYSIVVEGRPPLPPDQGVSANWYAVSPGYFATMRIPVVRGRAFTERDAADAPPVAIVNETLARRIFPGEDPIGRRLLMGLDGDVAREIVGIVGDVRHYGLDQGVTMQMYEPHRQRAIDGTTFLIRTGADTGTLAGAARRAILSIDPEQPVTEVRSLAAIVDESTAQRRFTLVLLVLFAAAALVLAAVGVYGVVAYTVSQRTHEIGVRMALGAGRPAIVGLVLRQGMTMVLAGVLAGFAGALALARLVRAMLYGVGAADPLTFAATVGLLCFIALAATYLPARRATRVEPSAALRCE